jgi:hypothetical protein
MKKLSDMTHNELLQKLIDLMGEGAIFGDDTLIDEVLEEILIMRKANQELKG